MEAEPTTLQEAVLFFASIDNCREYLVARRWPNGVTCPTCGNTKVSFLAKVNRWQCATHHGQRQFTLKTGTVMEDSPLGIDKWMVAMWLVLNCKNGISSYEVARALGISQKSAWHMLHRIRFALHGGSVDKLSGHVEVDETFIGGKARNMHRDRKIRAMQGKRGGADAGNKTIVLGILERQGHVRTTVISDRKKSSIQPHVRENVEAGSNLHSDEHGHFWRMNGEYVHNIVSHLSHYVEGNVHTNGLENFWSLLKRSIGGTYVSVEPFHLFRYVDEQAFRYNYRKGMNDSDRFDLAARLIVGKRLTWAEVTGKVQDHQAGIN